MSRAGVDYETIKHTAIKLLSQGLAPSVQKIREALGTGSNTTIAEHLKTWREEYAKKTIHHLPANMPKNLISTFEVLWQTAVEQAQDQLAEYKKNLDDKHETIVQLQRDVENAAEATKQKLVETTEKLGQQILENQKISVELAITCDRLAKQDDVLAVQKNQYEERLMRVYNEKDNITTQCHQLQDEIKLLQEKFNSQAQQHQNMLAQQNALHEQSEIRWLKFIDQSKQEAKETHKKLENMQTHYSQKINEFEGQLHYAQQELHEKSAHLTVNLERINQLKQEIKFLEIEYIKARSTILKLEEERNTFISSKNKSKKDKSTLREFVGEKT